MACTVFLVFLVHQVFHIAELRCSGNQERLTFGAIATFKQICRAKRFAFGKESRESIINSIVLLVSVTENQSKCSRFHSAYKFCSTIGHRSGISRIHICTRNLVRSEVAIINCTRVFSNNLCNFRSDHRIRNAVRIYNRRIGFIYGTYTTCRRILCHIRIIILSR